jgi:hypothetical protein
MSVFDTSVTASATLPTWFSDAQKSIATSGKTVYDAATPFSNTATASMSRDLFGTPSTQTYGMQPPNTGGSSADSMGGYAPPGTGGGMRPVGGFNQGPKTEDDWNRFSAMARFAPGTDMEVAKADFLAGSQFGGGGGAIPPGLDDSGYGGPGRPGYDVGPDGNIIGGISDPYMPQPTGGGLPTSSNPFKTAMDTLQGVATGAANPFLANGDPNKQTALGGLFAAQNARLDQILPGLTSQAGAGGIGGGNFGSLRGQTAVNTARAGALTTLAEQQNKAALDAQNYAIMAAKGVGDVGSQYSTSAINTGKEEMGADLNQLAKYSDIINAMGPTMDKTTTTTTKGSSYENLLKGLTAAGQAGVSIDKLLKGKTGLGWLDDIMKAGPNPETTGGSVVDGTYTDPDTGITYDVGGA